MREGNIGNEECVSTLAHFVPGSGRLLLLSGGKFLFVAVEDVGFDFSEEPLGASSNRDFFLICIERWFAASSKSDLIAGVVDIGCTSVLAIGRTPISVETTAASGLVDPSLASFAAERIFPGELVSLGIGDTSLLLGSNRPSTVCWAASGLLPADAFILSSSELEYPNLLPKRNTAQRSEQLAARSPAATTQTTEPPLSLARIDSEPSLSDETAALAAVTEPKPGGEAAASTSSLVSNGIPPLGVHTEMPNDFSEFDELLDGATVWPTAGRRMSPVSQSVQPTAALLQVESVELLRSQVVPVPPIAAAVGAAPSIQESPATDAKADPPGKSPGGDSWEPPEPEPSSFSRSTPIFDSPTSPQSMAVSAVVKVAESNSQVQTAVLALGATPPPLQAQTSETMTWGAPASNGTRMPELDSTEFTIMAGDLARIRRTFVEVAPTGNEAPIGSLIGVYCRAGHFTDSRSQRCLFCPEETDLDTMTSAAPPLLGVLAFDDNRVIPVTGLVLVGRKPSTNDPAITAVAFGEDMMLSRVHFEVRLVDWDVSVVDKQSANGTQIEHTDGRRIVARPNIEVRLEPGSIIRFGNHQATFRRS